MKYFMEALNHPAEAFLRRNKAVSWGLVGITILINSVFDPVLDHFCGVSRSEIDMMRMLKITAYGGLSYILVCCAFWIICKCFGSNRTLVDHIQAWGISYTPTAICAVTVAFAETFFYLFWNGAIWGMLLNIVFGGILIWKAILYCIYLRNFANLKGVRFWAVCAIMGVMILILAFLNAYVGVKTPVL